MNRWKCENCGSTDVHAEWAFMHPLNEEIDYEEVAVRGAGESGFYWCQACDDECDPVREK